MPKKSNEKTFLLRIESDTLEMVEKWAADEFRSVNGQLQWIINDAIRRYRKSPSRRTQQNFSSTE